MENLILDDQQKSSELRYAGFWIRLAALLVDNIILTIISFVITLIFIGGSMMSANPSPAGLITSLIICFLIQIGYFVYFESSAKQGTFGKQVVGIKVGNLDGSKISIGHATGRFFAKLLSAIILCIGYLMAGWDKKKQGLHDKMAGTIVFYK